MGSLSLEIAKNFPLRLVHGVIFINQSAFSSSAVVQESDWTAPTLLGQILLLLRIINHVETNKMLR